MLLATNGLTEWNYVLNWDAFGYYYYLPLFFIEKTITIPNLDMVYPVFEKYKTSTTLYQFTAVPQGGFIIRYSIGQAVLYLPFFLIGHVFALVTDYPADGFSKPYNLSILIGGFIYHITAIVIIAKLLLKFYSDKVVTITLIILFLGTNLSYNISGTALSSQGSALLLFAVFLTIVDSYYRKKTTQKMFWAGCVFGLICISRPTDFLIIIPAILWPLIRHEKSLKNEIKQLIFNVKHLAAFVIPTLFFAFIQFGYWKYTTGKWFINSYGNPGEGLDFLTPYTLPFLFSFKSGWLIYTPIMALVLIYLIKNALKGNKIMIVTLSFTVVFVYIASSWTNWWYGGGFSQRAMVQAYVLLCIPLAGLVEYTFFERNKFSLVLRGVLPALTLLSIWQTHQYKAGVLTAETVTAKYYFASFFDNKMDPEKEHLLDFNRYDVYTQPNYGLPENYIRIKEFQKDFDPISIEGVEFVNGFKIAYRDLCDTDHCYVVFTGVFEGLSPKNAHLVTAMDHKGNYGYQAKNIIENVVDTIDDTFVAKAVYLTPHIRNKNDPLLAYVWNQALEPLTVKQLKLEVYINPDKE